MSKIETHVISMCHLEHLDVWKLASQLLPIFVQAERYTVFVPDNQVGDFKQVTNPRMEVRSETELNAEFAGALRDAVIHAGNEKRYGWYHQQFCKFEALRTSTAARTVVWDADCVPLRPIELFDRNDRPIYMRATEFHADYFALVERWLGLDRMQTQSFIVPGFPILETWVDEFFLYAEERHGGQPWYDSLIAHIDFSLGGGFSEFETLGTWVSNRYAGQWKTSRYEWERYGVSRFGSAARITTHRAEEIGRLHDLDIVSFESWDNPNLRARAVRVLRSFYPATPSN